MPIVRFCKQGMEVEVPVGVSILAAARLCGAPIEGACGGIGACSSCHVYVDAGRELLSEVSDSEEDVLDKAFDVRDNSRLGCLATILADGVIDITIAE